jgi:hypothetical protein
MEPAAGGAGEVRLAAMQPQPEPKIEWYPDDGDPDNGDDEAEIWFMWANGFDGNGEVIPPVFGQTTLLEIGSDDFWQLNMQVDENGVKLNQFGDGWFVYVVFKPDTGEYEGQQRAAAQPETEEIVTGARRQRSKALGNEMRSAPTRPVVKAKRVKATREGTIYLVRHNANDNDRVYLLHLSDGYEEEHAVTVKEIAWSQQTKEMYDPGTFVQGFVAPGGLSNPEPIDDYDPAWIDKIVCLAGQYGLDVPYPCPDEVAQATNPTPTDGQENVDDASELSWVNGGGATYFNVYLGTDPSPDETEAVARVNTTTWDPPGLLQRNQIYYWRIDSTSPYGAALGDVWQFRVEN